jgi:hypothetical protein
MEHPKKKDEWDKASVVAQFISGVLIGAMTIVVSLVGHVISKAVSEAQLESAERKQTGDYVMEIAKADRHRRGELLGALDLSVRSADAIPIALHYAVSARTGAPSTERSIYDRSIEVLERLSLSADNRPTLERVKRISPEPDADITAGVLGDELHVRVRGSQIDDTATLTINGQPRLNLSFGQDSGWVDITPYLRDGDNHFVFKVFNDGGGAGGRLEISAGTQQYDTSDVGCYPSIEHSPAFLFSGKIRVEGNVNKNGSAKLFTEGPYFYDATTKE